LPLQYVVIDICHHCHYVRGHYHITTLRSTLPSLMAAEGHYDYTHWFSRTRRHYWYSPLLRHCPPPVPMGEIRLTLYYADIITLHGVTPLLPAITLKAIACYVTYYMILICRHGRHCCLAPCYAITPYGYISDTKGAPLALALDVAIRQLFSRPPLLRRFHWFTMPLPYAIRLPLPLRYYYYATLLILLRHYMPLILPHCHITHYAITLRHYAPCYATA